MEGVISIIGFLSRMSKDQTTSLKCLYKVCTVQGVFVGSRLQFEDMNQTIEAQKIKPVIGGKLFKLEEVKEAYGVYVGSEALWQIGYQGGLIESPSR